MTDTYQRLVEGDQADPSDPVARAAVQTMIDAGTITHVEDKKGEVWPVLSLLKASVKLNPKHVPPNKARLPFTQVASFGVMAPTDETLDAPAPQHAGRAHALLSASGAHRWINCTPSARISERYPDTTSQAAEEGTAAHELAEHKLRILAGLESSWEPSSWFDEDMDAHTDDYADCVMAELKAAQEDSLAAFLAIEQRLDFSHIVPDGFGTGDALIVGDGTLTLVDLKYGRGVEVSAAGNPQLRLYALGALKQFGMIYAIDTVRMVIFQPRLANTSIDEITVAELMEWAETVVKPTAELAMAGGGELRAGEWCTFCPHRAQCPALASLYMEPLKPMIEAAEPPAPDTLSDTQIAQIVQLEKDIKKWLTAVTEHALEKANLGHTYPGLKLVEGRSVRKYSDDDAVAKAVKAEGLDPWEHKLLGITAMTKLMGKKKFDALLGDLLVKPEGKPTLVPESDKRPALTAATADTVFPPIEETA